MHHVRPLHAVHDVGVDGQRGDAAATPEDGFLHHLAQRGHLRQRDSATQRRGDRNGTQRRQVVALVLRGPHDHREQLVTLMQRADGGAIDDAAQRPADLSAGQAHGTRPVLVHVDLDAGAALTPVQVRLDGVGVGTDHLQHLVGDALDRADIGSPDAELHREGHGRAQRREVGAGAHAGEVAGQLGLQAWHQAVAGLHVRGQHDELRVVGAVELLVQRQEVARAAVAHVGHEALHVAVPGQPRFQPLGLCPGGCQTGALGQPQIHQDLGAVGGREELLGGDLHAGHPGRQQQYRDAQRDPAVTHGALDGRAQPAVERGMEKRVLRAVSRADCTGLR